MSKSEIIIAVVTAVLVVFSVVVSVVIPKRDPSFPGRRNIVAFGLICAVLVGGTLAAVEVYGAEEGHGAEAAIEGEQAVEGEGEAEEPPAGESPPAPEPPAEGPPPAELQGDPAAGSAVFASAGCGSCHTLADAGATGAIGPSLDDARPSFELTVDRVTNGAGAMPAFADQLSPEQIDDVAAYVVSVTAG